MMSNAIRCAALVTLALVTLGLVGCRTPASWVPEPGEIWAADLRRHVEILTADDTEGRKTGTAGAQRATLYVAQFFEQLGLDPAGDDGTYFQNFEFSSGVSLGPDNLLRASGHNFAIDSDWRPLAFSSTGAIAATPVVFAGYGIVSALQEHDYDSYAGLDVRGKWVLALRFLPEDLTPQRRQQLTRYAGLRYKAMIARDRGARGLIVVAGPRSQVERELVGLAGDASLAGLSLGALSVRREVADRWLAADGHSLLELQRALDSGHEVTGFELPGLRVSAQIDLEQILVVGRNVVARRPGTGSPELGTIVVGAHLDHLGRGTGNGSLATQEERGQIHPGADDNASGVAAMLEIARSLGSLGLARPVVFGAWSGEESGLLGSSHYVNQVAPASPHALSASSPRAIAAYLNMDMIGRLRTDLTLNGLGSSSLWRDELIARNRKIGLSLALQDDSYVPSDATSFYLAGIPVLSAFTGAHAEYHTPRDTAATLDYVGMQRVATLIGSLTASLAARSTEPDYIAMTRPESAPRRAFLRAYLGTIPDYANATVAGLRLSGVIAGGPAEQGGLRKGDVIVELAGRRVENIYDYTYAIEALKVGETVDVLVERDGARQRLRVTPGSRD